MSGMSPLMQGTQSAYKEESVKPAVAVMILLVCAISLPLGWLTYQARSAAVNAFDLDRYTVMADQLKSEIEEVRGLLQNDSFDIGPLNKVVPDPFVPATVLPDPDESIPKTLDVELKAIYWIRGAPLVTIGQKNYRVGEKIDGFTIVEIRKIEVDFESPAGERITKYFYESLNEPKRK